MFPTPLSISAQSFNLGETFASVALNGASGGVSLLPCEESSPPTSPTTEFLPNAFVRQPWSKGLLICSECKFLSESQGRFQTHFKEPRHVYHFRNMAYKEPKRRQMWLKIWFSTLEAAEEQNLEAFEVDEGEEDVYVRQEEELLCQQSQNTSSTQHCLAYSIGRYKFKQ